MANETVDLLVRVMLKCEEDGEWPEAIALVIIALLPKTDGGYRPIGLMPFLPRLWSRVRRRCARKWEEENARTWLYAGKAKGANVAAWKQAMAAEVAATTDNKVKYAQALLDLVKAFDRIPLWLLVREAIALGYPLRILRLSIAVYKLNRVVRIGSVVSHTVVALRGITAGSGFATAEMRLIMIRAIDAALKLFPRVNPTLFVDDLAADMTAPANHLVEQLGGFIEHVAMFVKDTDQELSSTKSLCTASHKEVGVQLCERWAAKGISIIYKERVKALGAGLGAGVRRNMTVLRERYHSYRRRIPKFRRLRKVGVDTARLVRTGIRAMTYGSAITGVPDGLLRSQRQTVAAMTAPGAGTGGQNLDLALMLADGSKKGRADPAYDAHGLPIGEWSMAVWEGWESPAAMQLTLDHAERRFKTAKNQWSVTYGPGAAYLLTCRRLEWKVLDAVKVVTDQGTTLDLRLDPPTVITQHCFLAVQRWRWRKVEKTFPHLAATGSGRGPLWSLSGRSCRPRRRLMNGPRSIKEALGPPSLDASSRKRE